MKSKNLNKRQCVLVNNWKPLTIWGYSVHYFRFSASDDNPDNIMERFIDLTNNLVVKYAEQAVVSHEIEGNMWCLEEMHSNFQEDYKWDVWEVNLKE